ncbi:hypothetical protein C7389_1461, partial [Azoarcus indigens]
MIKLLYLVNPLQFLFPTQKPQNALLLKPFSSAAFRCSAEEVRIIDTTQIPST